MQQLSDFRFTTTSHTRTDLYHGDDAVDEHELNADGGVTGLQHLYGEEEEKLCGNHHQQHHTRAHRVRVVCAREKKAKREASHIIYNTRSVCR